MLRKTAERHGGGGEGARREVEPRNGNEVWPYASSQGGVWEGC